MNYNDVFHFLLFLKHDEAFEPWAALRYSLGHVVRMMGNTTVYRNFVRNVVEDTYGKLTPDNLPANNNVQITHHVNVMTVACGGNYGPCLDWAETKLKNYLQGTPPVE
ncbi:Protein of unknown function [Gryllus bimaculatus]|nr:Protein of unknown function [Gryllus bimaculatus]